jgi:glycerophosphoryl diester phosphodiesterase
VTDGLVCAHRGASLELPDNSMLAFVAAVASGCDLIETDVRMTADGELVLAHDLWDLDRDDLVTLEALLELASGNVGLDLEIVEVGLERALLDVVAGFTERLIVTSIFPEVLLELNRLTDSVETGLVIEAPVAGDRLGDHPFALADQCGATVTLVEDPLAVPQLASRAAADDRPLWVYTVNDERRLRELFETAGITGVITDDPALACDVRNGLRAVTGSGRIGPRMGGAEGIRTPDPLDANEVRYRTAPQPRGTG